MVTGLGLARSSSVYFRIGSLALNCFGQNTVEVDYENLSIEFRDIRRHKPMIDEVGIREGLVEVGVSKPVARMIATLVIGLFLWLAWLTHELNEVKSQNRQIVNVVMNTFQMAQSGSVDLEPLRTLQKDFSNNIDRKKASVGEPEGIFHLKEDLERTPASQ